jgi:hypothetical protein
MEALAAASKGETNGYSVRLPTSFRHTGSNTEFWLELKEFSTLESFGLESLGTIEGCNILKLL